MYLRICPPNLLDLELEGTSITNVPPLPNSIVRLWLGHGSPKTLTVLPSSLGDFDCTSCGLVSLPALPQSLKLLQVAFNQLTTIPLLPDSMEYVDVDMNNLTQLTNLPVYIRQGLNVSSNSGLMCLPNFSFIGDLQWSGTGLACTPSNNVTTSSPAISTLPLCSSSNPTWLQLHSASVAGRCKQ